MSRLDFGLLGWSRGWTEKEEEKKKAKKEENFPLCESIGHRTLRGRCPKMTYNDIKDLDV